MPATTASLGPTPLAHTSARLQRRKRLSSLFAGLCASTTILAFLLLIWLLWGVLQKGLANLDWQFVTSMQSRSPVRAGIKPALLGTLYVIGGTILFAVPIGIGAAVFLEEYSANNRWAKFVQMNIANLAGVPSVVYGILGLALFVSSEHLRGSIISGSITMALLVLPVIIIASQEALRAVPNSLRAGSYALGATQWQTIWKQVLPVAMPGIMTGIILAVSRAIGEAAPLLVVGAVQFQNYLPESPLDHFTVLPIQIFFWSQEARDEFKMLAASGIIVLLLVLLAMNAVAIWLRSKYDKSMK
jgi:phosphate transport system permease protein